MWGKKSNKSQETKNSPILEVKEEEKAPKKTVKIKMPKLKFGILRNISSIIDGRILTSELLTKNIPFIFFLVFLAILYIANNYNVQSKVRLIEKTTKELKDLRDEHISTKSSLMYFTKKSQVAKRLKDRKIKEATKPPYKIYTNKESK